MTSIITFRDASLPDTGISISDIPFPRGGIITRVGADSVVASGGRVSALVDYESQAEYGLSSSGLQGCMLQADENDIAVLAADRVTAAASLTGYGITDASTGLNGSTLFGGRSALTIAALVGSAAGSESDDYGNGKTILGGSPTGVTTPMLKFMLTGPRTIALTSRHSATSEPASQVGYTGLVPGRLHLVIAEIDFAGKTMAIEVDGHRRSVSAFAGKTGPSVAPSGLGMAWFVQRVGSAQNAGSQFTGLCREAFVADGLLSDAGKRLLREYWRPFQRRANGDV